MTVLWGKEDGAEGASREVGRQGGQSRAPLAFTGLELAPHAGVYPAVDYVG